MHSSTTKPSAHLRTQRVALPGNDGPVPRTCLARPFLGDERYDSAGCLFPTEREWTYYAPFRVPESTLPTVAPTDSDI